MRFTAAFGAFFAIFALVVTGPAQALERTEVPARYQWDLKDLYVDDAAWVAGKQELVQSLPAVGAWQGKLGESAASLREGMAAWELASRRADRLYAYAFQLYSQDTRVARSMQMQQEMLQVYNQFQSKVAFMRPEILAIGREKIDAFLAAEPRLRQYRMYFDDILRAAPHTLSPAEEQVFTRMSSLGATGSTVQSVFRSADMPFPEITLSSGEKVRLDAAGYDKYRASSNKVDRDAAFKAFWTRYNEFTRTYAATLNAAVEASVAHRDVRRFPTTLDASLFDYNIPRSVYTQLLADVNANLPTLHRYLKLRQKIMGLPQLGYEDLYAPIVQQVDLEWTPEQAMALTLDSFAPLGKDYVAVLRRGYADRWVDFMPNTGKSPGAFSNTVYGVHPYQLTNFNGAWNDVSTLAHESGHSMHSYLSNAKQPYATANYSLFVAEVASTLNENLLFHHALDQTKDDRTRLFLLASYLDSMRTTLFRQTLFAEFEMKMHEAVERGEALTGESLNRMYLELLRRYYGHDQGVMKVDELYAAEWAYIPHFYRPFYVYQYATSMIGGMQLADGMIGKAAVRSGKATASRAAYLRLMEAGSSKYPIELLQDAGVDMTTSGPFNAAMREMNAIMDEIERIYAQGTVR
ncbi:MAG: oligoendopeptidase F [Gammaproteobacteria bacterium]|nr:oligoendopeptidase F [Gammaproteobacteria bacterium]MDH4311821.1 oligoendopeptidase F [Gammaproteobacteria bacterium]